jgi:hypothetical protein
MNLVIAAAERCHSPTGKLGWERGKVGFTEKSRATSRVCAVSASSRVLPVRELFAVIER